MAQSPGRRVLLLSGPAQGPLRRGGGGGEAGEGHAGSRLRRVDVSVLVARSQCSCSDQHRHFPKARSRRGAATVSLGSAHVRPRGRFPGCGTVSLWLWRHPPSAWPRARLSERSGNTSRLQTSVARGLSPGSVSSSRAAPCLGRASTVSASARDALCHQGCRDTSPMARRRSFRVFRTLLSQHGFWQGSSTALCLTDRCGGDSQCQGWQDAGQSLSVL